MRFVRTPISTARKERTPSLQEAYKKQRLEESKMSDNEGEDSGVEGQSEGSESAKRRKLRGQCLHYKRVTKEMVAIIGAGPAGCMLARLLHERDISVTIFEGESSPDFRSQGGTLDLHTKTGQAALKQAGLYDEFLKHARYDGEALNFCTKTLFSYVKKSGGKEGDYFGRPEVDRPVLRQFLFESLPEGIIKWGYRLQSVDEDLRLHFEQGTESGFDLVVGADGAWSKVRPLLSDVVPFYSGIAGLSLKIFDAATREPELYKLTNRGSVFASSDGKSIMAQYMGSGEISISSWGVQPENWLEENRLDTKDASACKDLLRKQYADWDSRLLGFTQKADDHHIVPRNLYMLPIGFRWQNRPGITLIGDASHLMTPFAGEGVNLALEDAMKLADAIMRASQKNPRSHLDNLHAEVKACEEDMFVRATKTQRLTWNNLKLMFLTPGAPRTAVERFMIGALNVASRLRANLADYCIGALKDEVGVIFTPLVSVLVYTYFFFFKLLYW
ncbi:MAG: hypothetical protein M1822_004580 [Bathelium mastoideum]|nr:MAG: hypothetical protein M1822_004580 [Bathelium mastoideum]